MINKSMFMKSAIVIICLCCGLSYAKPAADSQNGKDAQKGEQVQKEERQTKDANDDKTIVLSLNYQSFNDEIATSFSILESEPEPEPEPESEPEPKLDAMNVSVPDDYPTIEEAYQNVKNGGTITIQPGKHELSTTLAVNRPVTFQGKAEQAEDVTIVCSSSHAFQITGASPSFKNLTVVSEANKCGSFYITNGSPKISGCIVTSRMGSGIYVEGRNSNPQVESCIIKECGRCGAIVYNSGRGTFKNCDIYENTQSGIASLRYGYPTVIGCKLHDGKQNGAFVLENGLGSFKNCEIYGNQMTGIEVKKFGNPTVSNCKIHDNKRIGVYIYNKGKGMLYNNSLEMNYSQGELQNWLIEPDAGYVKGSGNTPRIPIR